jgi:hypothetical protein
LTKNIYYNIIIIYKPIDKGEVLIYLTANVFAGDNYPENAANEINIRNANIWNNQAKDKDYVYICGNVVDGNIDKELKKLLKMLKGNITVLRGDTDNESNLEIFKEIGWSVANFFTTDEDNYRFVCGYHCIDPHLRPKPKTIICCGKENNSCCPNSVNVSFNTNFALLSLQDVEKLYNQI